ncbi:hypothetical protein [Spartinivicinus poritis]|uniref:Fido domain-containing protein n=1 Tax=Spartinivicinus poritis TaxID=2994640 RepID=A0ABT5U4D1_9GAMM|nr:hypothetical protein [Spartinivicinus sp. A2-2]MDE1461225.1 hypothetical protein [Spartinivicinus sp. A2-2]
MISGVLNNSTAFTGGSKLATNPSYKAISNLLAKQLSDRSSHQELTSALVKAVEFKQKSASAGLAAIDVAAKLKQAILDNDKINPEFKGLKDKLLTILIGIYRKLEAEPVLHKAMSNHKAFQVFDKQQTWRLMTDHSQQELRGEYGFEDEAGYLAAMFYGFSHMLATVEQPLDTTLLEKLQNKAVAGVLPLGKTMQEQLIQEQYGLPEITLPIGYQDQQATTKSLMAGDPLVDKQANASEAGLIELIKGYQLEPWFEVLGVTLKDGSLSYQDAQQINLHIKPRTAAQCTELTADILTDYSQAQSFSRTENDKLAAIARCCQELARAKPFIDGNIRTIGVLVANKLLLQQQLAPVIMPNPQRFTAFSAKELLSEIKFGQSLFENYTSTKFKAASEPEGIPSYAKFI